MLERYFAAVIVELSAQRITEHDDPLSKRPSSNKSIYSNVQILNRVALLVAFTYYMNIPPYIHETSSAMISHAIGGRRESEEFKSSAFHAYINANANHNALDKLDKCDKFCASLMQINPFSASTHHQSVGNCCA